MATALLFIGPAIQAISDGQNFFLVREGGREGGREGRSARGVEKEYLRKREGGKMEEGKGIEAVNKAENS